MNEEKTAWFFECQCGRKFVAHFKVAAECTRHSRPVPIRGELMPYREALRRLYGDKPKRTKKKTQESKQLSLGF